jgi:hypothetical protein
MRPLTAKSDGAGELVHGDVWQRCRPSTWAPASRSSLAVAAGRRLRRLCLARPVRNLTLLLEQCSRRWNLGVADATAPDYTI